MLRGHPDILEVRRVQRPPLQAMGTAAHPALHALLAIVLMATTWLLTDSSVTGVNVAELFGRMPTVQIARAGVRALRDVAWEHPQRHARSQLRSAGPELEAMGSPRALTEEVSEEVSADVAEEGTEVTPHASDLSLAEIVAQEVAEESVLDVFLAEDLPHKMLNLALEIIVRTLGGLIVGTVYYFRVVRGYPKLADVNQKDTAPYAHLLMSAHECEGCGMATSVVGCCALVCPAPRLAHTLHSAGKMNYWLGLVLGTFLQPCMVLYGSGCTSLRKDLGGDAAANMVCHRNTCAFCCSCCVIAKQAQALDMKVGWRTSWFGAHELLIDEDGDYMNIAMAAVGAVA